MPSSKPPNTGSKKLAYSVVEFCSLVGISRSKAYQLISTGELTALKIGTRTVVSSTELDRFITARPVITVRKGGV
ncbi:helix-turn-helix domain-containing protein [Chthonobacter rhizosphaerae]|uniref:helix-turn-helix domain-containing protein n=1 Tax=Chthonobacter rhizosphaerae TaxID=2735553 RepID=UPI0015EFCBB5|nr:helix-turn-helix domain-containing protein [Chthonobacter rhizosphaerae]